jgi:hypothetical protein
MCTTEVYFENYFTFFSRSKKYAKPYFLSVLAKKNEGIYALKYMAQQGRLWDYVIK